MPRNRTLRRSAGAGLTAIALLLACGSPGAATAKAAVSPEQAEALGKQAYDYGFPLLEFLRVRREETSVHCPDHKGNAPVNSFSNAKRFADATARTVVAPNTDTLYSIAHLDLGHGPIVLSHPNMGRRYYSFELLDPYTNVIDIRGIRKDGGGAGSFEIRWSHKPGKSRSSAGAKTITSKYRRVWVIGRTLATDPADQRRAYRKMVRYRLSRPDGSERTFPKGCKPGRPGEFPTPTDGRRFVNKLNVALEDNPPPPRDRPLLAKLATVGIGPGLSPARAGLSGDALAALYKGVSDEAAALPTNARLQALSEALGTEGWLLPASNIGDYGTDYAFRAAIAVLGLGANTPDEAIYPTALADSGGALFNGANDYRLTFPPGDEPPAKYFWSLTMYDSDGYLVPNPSDRYSLGPSHPPLLRKPDGSIVIAVQRARPAETDVNWLPSPPAGFRLNLRLYGPSGAARTGVWRPPGVVKVGG